MANTEGCELNGGATLAPATLLADIERAINHAYESGYISGHNDTCEGCFNEDTAFVAKDRSSEIVTAVKAHIAANQLGLEKEYADFVAACGQAIKLMSANVDLSRPASK